MTKNKIVNPKGRQKASRPAESSQSTPRSNDPRITQAVKETVSEYREVLKRLAQE